MRKLKLLFLAAALTGSVGMMGQTAPFLLEKADFSGVTVSSLSTFVPSGPTYTLELTGCVAGTEITVSGGSFSYTPETSGIVRFVRNGGDVVYVYEGTTYKGTATVSTPADPTFPEIYSGVTDDSSNKTGIYSEYNLIQNPGFETLGDKISDGNYKGINWDCNGYNFTNKSRVRNNTTLTGQEGKCTFFVHGYGSGNSKECLSQSGISLNNFTNYKIQFLSWKHEQNNIKYTVSVGTSAGNGSILSQEISLPNNGSKNQEVTFQTGAIEASTYTFSLTRVSANGMGDFDRMTMVAANGGGIGITGATGATFLSGSAYAPDGAFGASTSYSLASPYATSLVKNGTFDSNKNEWTSTTGVSNNETATNQTGAFTGKYWQNWNSSAFTGKMYQSANDVPNGTYKLKIAAFVNSVDGDKGQYVYLNSNKSYVYTTTPTAYVVYAYVNDHTLEYGLNQSTAVTNWMGIDNVSLEYCGATDVTTAGFKAIYDAVTTHIDDATYEDVVGEERTNLQTAIYATPTATADGYAQATFNINYADYLFTSAKASYDELATAISTASSAATVNVGTDAFQIPTSEKETLEGAIATAQGVYESTTASKDDVESATTTLNDAVTAYFNSELNAPDESDAYSLYLVDGLNKTVTFKTGNATSGGYAIGYTEDAGSFYNQAIYFMHVSGNQYKLYIIDAEGIKHYLCAGAKYSGGNNNQIRTIENVDNALLVQVIATETDGVYNLKNLAADALIGSSGDTGFYTAQTYKNFNINAAAKNSVEVIITAAEWATTILPFEASIPTGITAYSVSEVDGDVLTLVEVTTGKFEANTPYILSGEATTKNLQGYGLAKDGSYNVGLLTGVYTATDAPIGSYVLQNNDSKVGFYKVEDAESQPSVGANRCYLTVPAGSKAAYFFDSEALGINAIDALTAGEAEVYSLNGVRLPGLQKGMNIIRMKNGRTQKVMVK